MSSRRHRQGCGDSLCNPRDPHKMLRALVLLLGLLAPLASAEETLQWLPVAGKVAVVPGERI